MNSPLGLQKVNVACVDWIVHVLMCRIQIYERAELSVNVLKDSKLINVPWEIYQRYLLQIEIIKNYWVNSSYLVLKG